MGGKSGKVRKPATKKATEKARPTAPCHFCGENVDADDYLCRGCGKVICDECDKLSINGPFGPHEPERHREGLDA